MPWWISFYLNWNVNRIFKKKNKFYPKNEKIDNFDNSSVHIPRVSEMLQFAEKPILLIGSQVLQVPKQDEELADAVRELNIPTFVSGMARGLLSKSDLPIFRHQRKKALKEADLVILAGVPCDFRLDYGRVINHQAKIISINLSRGDMYLNRRPARGILTEPGSFLINWNKIEKNKPVNKWDNWHQKLAKRNEEIEKEIMEQGGIQTEYINPIK